MFHVGLFRSVFPARTKRAKYEGFEDLRYPDIADHLLRSLDANSMEKWTSVTENIEYTRFNLKAWGLL